jgi:hypothetical protein
VLLLSAVASGQAGGGLAEAKRALAAREFVRARGLYAEWLAGHPESVDAELGVADADLGLKRYEAAELEYRHVVAMKPEMWLAHKNLVVVEAALGRWEEFDRERAVLRGARERGAPGISRTESDVIDAFDVNGQHWIVREYYVPVGRALSRYNFERFGSDGRVKAYVSLESAEAARAALTPGDVVVGRDAPAAEVKDWVLDFYTGAAHGEVRRYPAGEPRYERVRGDVMRWLRRR